MAEREALIERFLAAQGWAGAERRPMTGDASHRRYERIGAGRRRAVLMDSPPARDSLGPFMRIGDYLRARGYSAPQIYAADEAAGLMLLEDLGEDRYTELIDRGDDPETLFAAAMDVLIDLHDSASLIRRRQEPANQRMHAEPSNVSWAMVHQILGPGDPGRL